MEELNKHVLHTLAKGTKEGPVSIHHQRMLLMKHPDIACGDKIM